MVGSTDCAFWQRMGLDYIGSQYKEGDLSESDVYNILKSCYNMTDRAIADFILRYSDQDDVPVGPTPPEELPPEDPTDCRLWSGAGRPYTDVILEANAGMLNSGQVNQILNNCYEMDEDEIERIITELFYASEDDEGETIEGGGVGNDDPIISKDLDPLLVILGAIVLGMVFYYTLNTTKEAL
jgi:hypothetical protein